MKQAIQVSITGQERMNDFTRPLDALIEFYKAFNTGDYDLMQNNWLNSPESSMSNPLGEIKRGWVEIKTVYENIFSGPADVYVEYYDYCLYQHELFFHTVGREKGYFSIGGNSIDLKIRTSRTFVFSDGRYHQLHHHGSIEDPALLAEYQAGVKAGRVV